MNNQPNFKNEDFLAECTTNVFTLTDLHGLKWRKYCCLCENVSNTTNDPVLYAYTLALKADILCVWHRLSHAPASKDDPNSLLLNSPKELIIFWYGEEPVIPDVPGPDLKAVEFGMYENGISNDTLHLFFKAIHNVIEKFLLNGKFIRLGKWFTEYQDNNKNNITRSLAFSFSIFIHGESTVAAAVDIQEKNAVRPLSHDDLMKTSVNVANPQSRVLLAPNGLDAYLTSNSLADTDTRSVKILEEWKKFFPAVKVSETLPMERDKCPAVVEVMVGDVKMLYPSCLVTVPVMLEKVSNSVNTTKKVVGKVWKKVKHKEEQHSPKEQLWDFKENCIQSNCGCSSTSNSTRVKNSGIANNPFSNTFNPALNPNSVSQKSKYSAMPTFTNFHQRSLRTDKNRLTPLSGRLTPSISGRVTPSISLPQKVIPSSAVSSSEKPGATAPVIHSLPHTILSPKIESYHAPSMTKEHSSSLLCNPAATPASHPIYRNEKKSITSNVKDVYYLPSSLNMGRPQLQKNNIEPRQGDSHIVRNVHTADVITSENASLPYVLIDEDDDLKEKPPVSGVKREGSVSCNEINQKKIKTEPCEQPVARRTEHCEQPVARRGPGRPKVKKGNDLSPIQISNSDEDAPVVPTTRRTSVRTANKGRKHESPITSPRSDSSPNPIQGRKRTHRNSARSSTKTPNTPKSDAAVFNFGAVKNTFPSSQTYFSPKDIMPHIDDLKHMFEEEDNCIRQNSMEVLHAPPCEDNNGQLTTSNLTTTTAAGLTQQDLAQMFPTPPSHESLTQTMSPIMSVQHELHVAPSCLLTPEVHHVNTISTELSTEPMEPRSPFTDSSTFWLPRMQFHPIPSMYAPLTLPRRKSDQSNVKLKYTPSWDISHNPPVLSRRPSGTRSFSVTDSVDVMQSTTQTDKTSLDKMTLDTTTKPLIDSSATDSKLIGPIQSLIEILLLSDCDCEVSVGFGNGVSLLTNQNIAGRCFYHQNLNWKSSLPNLDGNLFPEDFYQTFMPANLCHNRGMMNMDNVKASRHTLSNECLEMFLKMISSPLSVQYLYDMVVKYYPSSHGINSSLEKICSVDTNHSEKNKLLKELQPFLEKSLQNPARKNMWDVPKVNGPLTFSRLNNISNRKSLQSMLSTSSLLFNYDGDMLSMSPSAAKYWQSIYLEPYGGTKNVAYIVVLPDSDFIVNGTKQFFKELNSIYESMNLGKHCPIVKDLRQGLIRITQKYFQKVSETPVDNWFCQNDSKLMQKLKVVAQFCKHQLGPYLASLTLDNSLYINKAEAERNVSSAANSSKNPSSPGGTSVSSQNASNIASSIPASVYDDTPSSENRKDQPPALVIYMVDPFHSDSLEESCPRLWSYIGLMKCFVEMNNQLDKVKDNIVLQVIPLEQILQLNLNSRTKNTGGNQNPELQNLALSIYSRCKANPMSWVKKDDKCMTGFGMSNTRDQLVRRRQMENNLPRTVYLPPFILSDPFQYLKTNSHSMMDANSALTFRDIDVNILFCCYCLSRDNQWLLVTCTDKLGELNESTLIRITYPKRKKHKSLIWSITLRKMWEFINNVTSFTVMTWRVVLSKVGHIGHFELNELHRIIQESIQTITPAPNYGGCRTLSSPLSSDSCAACAIDDKRKGQCVFKSISLCSILVNTEIQFLTVRLTRHMTLTHSRVFVMPAPNSSSGKSQIKMTSQELFIPDNQSLLNHSFDEDVERDTFHTILPMLDSPSDHSIFPTSPSLEMSKMLSPPYSNSIPSLSPFQPIATKKACTASPAKATTTDSGENLDRLAVGFLLSGSPLEENHGQPHIMKSDLHIHVTSSPTQLNSHPLNSSNHMDVLRCILEHFDSLSWLTIEPSTGQRSSCLPIHVKNVLTTQDLLANICC